MFSTVAHRRNGASMDDWLQKERSAPFKQYCSSMILKCSEAMPNPMIHKNARIVCSDARTHRSCTVSGRTLIADFASSGVNRPHAYLIVEGDEGVPIGVVSVDEVRRKLKNSSQLEREVWLGMPIEAALNGRITLPGKLNRTVVPKRDAGEIPCTVLSQNDELIAIVSEDDVLVSWRSIEPLIQKAQCDQVTSLPTRSVFDSHLNAEYSRANRTGRSVAVILADIDHFKDINDQLGHAAGDTVLAAVARTIRNTFRSYDVVARYGGDEFAVLCCGCFPGEIAHTIERLRTGVMNLQIDGTFSSPSPTVSIGACVMHDPSEVTSPELLVQTADECLYVAKRQGRNRTFARELGLESGVLC